LDVSPASLEGRILRRGDPGYEELRRRGHNALQPDRYPELIVRPETEAEVVAAVLLAHSEGLKVKARSGGHSWTASSVRDGMLIDLEALDEITIDPMTRTATVQPGVKGEDLGAALRAHGLFFPGGHCPTVCVGGYLLQGGFGWNGRFHGPACASVRAVDVVTAAGELVHADETESLDLLWAVRGSGSGFFGVVTRYTVDVYERPKAIFRSAYVYPLDELDAVLRFAMEVEERLLPTVEFALLGTTPRLPQGGFAKGGTALVVAAAALCETEEEARAGLAPLEDCPVLDRAVVREVAVATEMDELYDGADALEPPGWRYAPDNMWTNAEPDDLIPAVRDLFTTVPNDESHVFWWPWRAKDLPDMAFSVQARLYIAAFSAWTDDDEGDEVRTWGVDQMRRLEPFSVGIQLADENLLARPHARYLSEESSARLEGLRAEWDPDGLFHGYLKGEA
jgi:FAD/FMN-containing dehydrogenase